MSKEWAFMLVIAVFLCGICFLAIWKSWMDQREEKRIELWLERENYRHWRREVQDDPCGDTFPEEWTRV